MARKKTITKEQILAAAYEVAAPRDLHDLLRETLRTK